jgi:4-hydroxy-tetrahydrodipicolinate synthase
MSSKLSGVFVPVLIPYKGAGEINEEELRRFVRWLVDKGIHGLYTNGSTGEFTRLTAEERKRVTQVICEEARGRVPVLAGAAEANVAATIQACETYAEFGARAVAIVSPYYYRLEAESVYAYFAEIATRSPIDLMLYNIPMFATPMDLPTIRRLAEFPRVIGIKDSTGDLTFMMRMIAAVRPLRPGFSFLTGWDPVLVPMLRIGCDGGTNATCNVLPEEMRRIFDLASAGDFDDALDRQYRILTLFDAMIGNFEFPDGFRAAAELRGFSFGQGRQPMTQLQMEKRLAQKAALGHLFTSLGFSDSDAIRQGGLPQQEESHVRGEEPKTHSL